MAERTYVAPDGRRFTEAQAEAQKARQDERLRKNPNDPAAIAAQRAWNAFNVAIDRQRTTTTPSRTFTPNPDVGGTTRMPVPVEAPPGAKSGVEGPIGTPAAQAPVEDPNDARLRRDAMAYMRALLASYGLEDLADFAWGLITTGASTAEVELALRDTPQFKKRFAAIEQRRQSGKNALTPGQVIAYENQARAIMREAAIPEGFYDSYEDFTNYLVNDVSLAELGDRIAVRQRDVYAIPAEARAEFRRLYNLTEGDLTAYFLDPTKALPVLKRRQEAGIRSGAAVRSGFGSLTAAESERLVETGVSEGAAQEGFGTLAQSRELFTPIDLGEDVITRDEQIEGTFSNNAAARERIARRQRRRQAAFQGGGGFAASQGGLVGLGSAEA